MFEGVPVDNINGHSRARFRERDRQRCFGHAVHAERRLLAQAVRGARLAERLDGRRVDRLRTVEREAPSREIEPRRAPHGPCRQRVREVRAARHGRAELGDPAHPVAGDGEEILWCREGEVEARQHRRHQHSDEPHVVIQRKPRDTDVLGSDARGLDDRIDVLDETAVGQHHALRVIRRPARELQDADQVGIVRRPFPMARVTAQLVERDRRRISRAARHERGERRIDENQRGLRVADTRPRLGDELFE